MKSKYFLFVALVGFYSQTFANTESITNPIELLNLDVRIRGNPKQVLEQFCHEVKGQLINQWQCPNSGESRVDLSCLIVNESNEKLIFNGCSKVDGVWADTFFPACVIHDFCYHNEPGANKLQKSQCDDQFLANMQNICKTNSDQQKCLDTATAFYLAVAGFGKKAWNCSKEKVQYPRSLDELLNWRRP